ncbi:MAG: kptA [Mucilaginibacter sp.]|nr:kptA [Mucilaginibacter sp.]
MEHNLTGISKAISHALRHEPSSYGLTLDEDGYVRIEDLVNALKKKCWASLTYDDITKMVNDQQKIRHEIKGDKIRASYGHSVKEAIIKHVSNEPPDILYHGTKANNYHKIMEFGLLPMSRQFVHLSETVDIAHIVAGRRKGENIILSVEAKRAHAAGINFYCEAGGIWLSDEISPLFIKHEVS